MRTLSLTANVNPIKSFVPVKDATECPLARSMTSGLNLSSSSCSNG